MGVKVVVGTDKGGFLLRSDDARSDWQIEGPFFKGWKLTATARSGDRYLAATASQVYGPSLHLSDDLKTWRQIDTGPAWPKNSDRKLTQVWRIVAAGDRIYAGVDEAGLFVSADAGETWAPRYWSIRRTPSVSGSASRPSACSAPTTAGRPSTERTRGSPS